MKRLSVVVVLGAALGLLAGQAAAQPILQNEVSIFGVLDDVSQPEDFELSIINLRYGRYLSPQAVATLGLSRTRFNTSFADAKTLAITVGAKYYFAQLRPSAIAPFLEAAVGWANTDTGGSSSNDLTWELGGGVAYFLTERTSIDGSIRWYQTDTSARTEGLRMFLGLTTRF